MADAVTKAPEIRGCWLVRDGKTGRPKLDLPMREYPEWAQAAFRADMTPDEIKEFFA
jgi:hypothetical protein